MSLRMFFIGGSSYIFAADKHGEAKCGLAAQGLGQPLFFPHGSFLYEQEEERLCLLATHKHSSHDFTVSLRLRRISTQMTGVE